MGWADLLVRLGIPYDAPEALALADERHGRSSQREAHAASEALARERGRVPRLRRRARSPAPAAAPRRNATVTTIAPTGTLALIAGCSSGIEPLFALAYVRRALDDAELPEEHPLLAARSAPRARRRRSPAVRAAGARARRSPACPSAVARVFATAHDVAPEAHVRMQAAFQRHVDNGVSKTINLPRERHGRGRGAAPTARASSSAARGSPSTATARARSRCSPSGATRNGEAVPAVRARRSTRSGGC